MSEQQFDIIFRGDIVLGHQLTDVKMRLQQLFKADAAKIDALFSGKPVPLKRGLDQASAQKYKDALVKAGALVDVIVVGDIASTEILVEPRPIATNTAPTAPLTLAQRLQQQEVTTKETEQKQPVVEVKVQVASSTSSLSLAPMGVDLLNADEKHTEHRSNIDTSGISLRAEGGNLVDASEQYHAPIVPVRVPSLVVAEVGADLVRADEKINLPLAEIELDNWTIAEAGTDLIAAAEKPAVETSVIVIPDVELAPVGADLGQSKPSVQRVMPDISGLKLADL